MKDLIIGALNDAHTLLETQLPKTKKLVKSISIMDVKPTELNSFMVKNNIPEDACFSGRDNGYDGFDDIGLSWDIVVPTTDTDILNYKLKRFSDIAFKIINRLLIDNGYRRLSVNSGSLKEFKNIYDMYMDKDFDLLVKYYSLFFFK